MSTQIELLYVLRKHKSSDRYDSELLTRIPLAAGIQFLTPAQMDTAAPNAVMGVSQIDSTSIMNFVRHTAVAGLDLPDHSRIRKVIFRILTNSTLGGQEREVAVSYEIAKNRCEVVPIGPLPGHNWVALLSLEGGNFRLRYRKQGGGPGGSEPCAELNCADPPDWIAKIKCLYNNCG